MSNPFAVDDLVAQKIRWPTTFQPTALGELGMDVATGKPRAFIGGAAVSLVGDAVVNTFSKAQNVATVTLADGANIALDASLSNVFKVTLAGASAQLDNPTNLVDGQTILVRVIQASPGGRALTFGSNWDFGGAGAPDLTTSATGEMDLITAVSDGTKVFAVVSRGFTA